MKNKLQEPKNVEVFMPPDKLLEDMIINAALRDRKIYLADEVTRESIFKVIYFMDRLREIDRRSGTKELKDIEIVIDSYGGYISHGLALMSKMEQFKELGYKIITTVNSVAMSMGFMILVCASERRALRHSRIMCHQPASGTWGFLQQMEEDVEETQQCWIKLKEIITKYTKITDEQLEDIKRRKYDWYMWPEEALELGVIDKII